MKTAFVNHLNRFFHNNNSSKKYNNEKAIISFTSWRARINYVHITLKTLINQILKCHIVLVLSSDEFPLKEKELPKSLLMLLDYFEILWVKENTKTFKKVYPTIIKYKDLNTPILCADDDCSYKPNFAEEMINHFEKEGRDCFVRYGYCRLNKSKLQGVGGASGLYPPCYFQYCIDYYNKIMLLKDKEVIYNIGDDSNAIIIKENNLKLSTVHEYDDYSQRVFPYYFNETIDISPIHANIKDSYKYKNAIKY